MINFVDLYRECENLKSVHLEDRVIELSNNLPSIALCAVGGFPIEYICGDNFYWCDAKHNKETLKNAILQALGFSGVLTFTNKNHKSLRELGNICNGLNHHWGFHWINISIVFSNHDPKVEMSFARDNRFHLSWVLEDKNTSKIFVATAGIKEFISYISHKDDKSFDKETRKAMHSIYNLLEDLI